MSTAARPERSYIYNSMMTDSRRWDGFKPRDGDIIISTSPKCGTTWMQMICALLIFQKTRFERKLSDYSPWLDMPVRPIEEILGVYEAQTHRRFIKTHTPLDGIPYFQNVIYLFVARDPRDAFISMGNHQKNLNPEVVAERLRLAQARNVPLQTPAADRHAAFRNWLNADAIVKDRAKDANVPEFDILHHAQTFWEFRHLPNIHLLHYGDMKADLEGQMRRIADAIGVTVDVALWPKLVEAASFEQMKENADALVPVSDDPGQWRDNAAFFNKGAQAQWQGVLGDAELELYRQVMDARLAPELAHWLEHGWQGKAD